LLLVLRVLLVLLLVLNRRTDLLLAVSDLLAVRWRA
jgi:hypothetical protein